MPNKNNEDGFQTKTKSKLRKTVLIMVPLFLFQLLLAYFIVSSTIKPEKIAKTASLNEGERINQDIGEIYIIEDIVVNPRETRGMRFVNVSIGLDCNNGKTLKAVGKQDIRIRDYLISLFSNCLVEELDDEADKDTLRKKIRSDINRLINNDGVQAVYFTNFILN